MLFYFFFIYWREASRNTVALAVVKVISFMILDASVFHSTCLFFWLTFPQVPALSNLSFSLLAIISWFSEIFCLLSRIFCRPYGKLYNRFKPLFIHFQKTFFCFITTQHFYLKSDLKRFKVCFNLPSSLSGHLINSISLSFTNKIFIFIF